jgi:hypothetical protein
MKKRTLKDGSVVNETEDAQTLTIKTKCPAKWLLIDRETGEAYEPYDTAGKNQWRRVYHAEWSIDA